MDIGLDTDLGHDTIMFSEDISEVESGRAQIAVADFVASWDSDGRIGS